MRVDDFTVDDAIDAVLNVMVFLASAQVIHHSGTPYYAERMYQMADTLLSGVHQFLEKVADESETEVSHEAA